MLSARIKVVIFFIEMTCNITPTHGHFEWHISDRSLKPDQLFVLNRFGGRSVFGRMYRLKLINRQIWESLNTVRP